MTGMRLKGDAGNRSDLGQTVIKGIVVCGMNIVTLLAPVAACADWNTAGDSGTVPLVALADGGIDLNAPDELGRTPLHIAVEYFNIPAVITTLIEAGADPNASDGSGTTPLHTTALFTEVPAVITTLVEAGADPNAPDLNGFTPLHMAAAYTRVPAVIIALVDGGADPDAKDQLGRTPLYLASAGHHCILLQNIMGAQPSSLP